MLHEQSQRHNFLQRLIRRDPLRPRVRLSVRRSDPFPLLSSPSAAPFRSLAPLRFPLFPAPLNAQHAVCPERQRKGKWKAAARAVA